MPSQEATNTEAKSPEGQLFDAITSKSLDTVKQIVSKYPKINLNCLDKDELTPLQHACHTGDVELARFLLDNGAGVNFTKRKDGYTPLMFAAISSRAEVVQLLLERGVDTTVHNCVNRTASEMAAFVGQSKIVAIISSWQPYENTIEPYTRCRELEDKPRIPSPALGRLLHCYVVYPSLHPVKLFLHIKENLDLLVYAKEFIYVLDDISSRSLKPPINDEGACLKYYYYSYLIQHCFKGLKDKPFDAKDWEKSVDIIVRRLVKRDDPNDCRHYTPQLHTFMMECIMKFPYTYTAIFKTMTFALSKRDEFSMTTGASIAYPIFVDTLTGPRRSFGKEPGACFICEEENKTKACGKCKTAYYCGPSCQRADWFQHKKVCKSPEETPLLDDHE